MGYDPALELPADHLARLVDQVVDQTVSVAGRQPKRGNIPYDPRLCLKVLVYGYALGIRSSRQLEEMCRDRLSFKLLTRGHVPNYHTLCNARVGHKDLLEQVWVGLLSVAEASGIKRCGRIVVDSTKLRANASPEAVLKEREYESVLREFERILQDAAKIDSAEAECAPAETRTGKSVDTEQMRDILRRVRKQMSRSKQEGEKGDTPAPPVEKPKRLTARMRRRVQEAKSAIEDAQAAGRKNACITDPDARMMSGTRENKIQECHSFEAVTDNGVLVAAQSTQVGNDNGRLEELVDAARAQEPEGVKAVTADSGYYSGDMIARLAASGIDTCVPDSNTAADIRRGLRIGATAGELIGTVLFKYDAEHNCYHCPEGNVLRHMQERQVQGQMVSIYGLPATARAVPWHRRALRAPLRSAGT